MKYNLLYNISHHFTTHHITLHLNTTRLTHFLIIHILKDQNTISLNQSISINTRIASFLFPIFVFSTNSSSSFLTPPTNHSSLFHIYPLFHFVIVTLFCWMLTPFNYTLSSLKQHTTNL